TTSIQRTNATISACSPKLEQLRPRPPCPFPRRSFSRTALIPAAFRFCTNMLQHSYMDVVNDIVRPPVPIRFRPHGMRIPRRAFDARTTARQFRQQELPLMRFEISVQVSRLDVAVRRQLIERSRIRRHVEAQQMRLIPNNNWLDERSCRKHALPNRPGSVSFDFRANRI